MYEDSVWLTGDGRTLSGSLLSVDRGALEPSVTARLHVGCWAEIDGDAAA